jgi:tetratricopeptide (TPR) repeat protein
MSAQRGPCLDDDRIAALIAGALGGDERASLLVHIDACDDCRLLVADAARPSSAPARSTRQPGASFGRYLILETVGAGAMGVVHAAYDPELDRRVALKLLRDDPLAEGTSGDEGPRLLREAQSLARLAHPNVITIHDVGTIDGEVFLAMEFVDCGTLGDWLAVKAPRPWREALAMFRQAGEGLAAAHAAGLVHRDFKPDNVLVGSDGRVRVTDFGLARREVEGAPRGPVGAPEAGADLRLTRTGALVGTPAYMAPERLAGEAGDARSDQFSFCVALHEALHGERPFAGADVPALRAAIAAGAVTRAAPGNVVPAWLRRIVQRGLAPDPARRFPSLRDLLDALDRGADRRPRRVLIGAALLFLAPVLAALALRLARPAGPPVCAGADRAWGEAWDGARASAVREAFLRSGRPTAPFALAEVTRALDAYRAGWLTMRDDACAATRLRGEQSEALLDLRMRCLDDRRREVEAFGRLLAEADGPVVDRAISAVISLPSIQGCADARALSSPVPPPPSVDRARLDALSGRLAEASALHYAGHYARGLALAEPAVREARAIGYAPVLARLLLVDGRLAYGMHDLGAAEPLLHEAAAVAIDAHEDLVAADAWTMLVRTTGGSERHVEARIWARYAESAILRAGGDDEREATRLRFLATPVWRRERSFDEAEALIGRARELFARSRSARYDFDVASCDEGIAGIDFDRGRPDLALPLHRRVAAVRERLFGSEHPSVAVALVNLGEDLTRLGRAAEAVPLLERALVIAAPLAEKGGDGYVHYELAAALRGEGDARRALAEDDLAHASCERAGEIGTYWESFSLTGRALDLLALGRAVEAVAPAERAVALRAKSPVGPELAEARFALARALGDAVAPAARAQARALAREALRDLGGEAAAPGAPLVAARAAIDAWLAAHAAPR